MGLAAKAADQIFAFNQKLDYNKSHAVVASALLVQLVERRSPKPDVGGSSPPGRVYKLHKLQN